jgi:hypothetical protein
MLVTANVVNRSIAFHVMLDCLRIIFKIEREEGGTYHIRADDADTVATVEHLIMQCPQFFSDIGDCIGHALVEGTTEAQEKLLSEFPMSLVLRFLSKATQASNVSTHQVLTQCLDVTSSTNDRIGLLLRLCACLYELTLFVCRSPQGSWHMNTMATISSDETLELQKDARMDCLRKLGDIYNRLGQHCLNATHIPTAIAAFSRAVDAFDASTDVSNAILARCNVCFALRSLSQLAPVHVIREERTAGLITHIHASFQCFLTHCSGNHITTDVHTDVDVIEAGGVDLQLHWVMDVIELDRFALACKSLVVASQALQRAVLAVENVLSLCKFHDGTSSMPSWLTAACENFAAALLYCGYMCEGSPPLEWQTVCLQYAVAIYMCIRDERRFVNTLKRLMDVRLASLHAATREELPSIVSDICAVDLHLIRAFEVSSEHAVEVLGGILLLCAASDSSTILEWAQEASNRIPHTPTLINKLCLSIKAALQLATSSIHGETQVPRLRTFYLSMLQTITAS